MSTSKTKRHKTPKMGGGTAPDYKLPPLCTIAYPNRPYEHMVSLLLRRPFKGTRIDCEHPGEEGPRENDITKANQLKVMGRNVDTRSIDVLIILMRALCTFDAEMVQAQSTAAESALVEATQRDVGGIMDHDLHKKLHEWHFLRKTCPSPAAVPYLHHGSPIQLLLLLCPESAPRRRGCSMDDAAARSIERT
jgi:hypothetical protein